jgi:hypothetical protein
VSLSADGGTLAIGSPLYGAADEGHVRVFRYNSGIDSWDLYGSAIDGTIPNKQFVISPKTCAFRMLNKLVAQGFSVSLSNDGNTVAIGAPHSSDNLGRTHVYYHDGSDWLPLGTAIVGESGSGNSKSVMSHHQLSPRV